MTVEQKQIRSYRGAKFVFLVLCFVMSHRHNAGVPAVYTVFRHVSCYLTTASIPEIIEVTDVPHCQYKINLHTSSTLCVKKRQLCEKLLFYETRRFITSLQGPANELYPKPISYSFFTSFQKCVQSRDPEKHLTIC
jgi:hypothetical protein